MREAAMPASARASATMRARRPPRARLYSDVPSGEARPTNWTLKLAFARSWAIRAFRFVFPSPVRQESSALRPSPPCGRSKLKNTGATTGGATAGVEGGGLAGPDGGGTTWVTQSKGPGTSGGGQHFKPNGVRHSGGHRSGRVGLGAGGGGAHLSPSGISPSLQQTPVRGAMRPPGQQFCSLSMSVPSRQHCP